MEAPDNWSMRNCSKCGKRYAESRGGYGVCLKCFGPHRPMSESEIEWEEAKDIAAYVKEMEEKYK